jgi:hypothetical protein
MAALTWPALAHAALAWGAAAGMAAAVERRQKALTRNFILAWLCGVGGKMFKMFQCLESRECRSYEMSSISVYWCVLPLVRVAISFTYISRTQQYYIHSDAYGFTIIERNLYFHANVQIPIVYCWELSARRLAWNRDIGDGFLISSPAE